jgi:hypothetical protein
MRSPSAVRGKLRRRAMNLDLADRQSDGVPASYLPGIANSRPLPKHRLRASDLKCDSETKPADVRIYAAPARNHAAPLDGAQVDPSFS